MAEEDLDLDDDLDLGDEDGGDDFAGELDDMMGDDELGDDSADSSSDSSDGNDSELDSFFEDLSSIEDMDEGSGEPESDMEESPPPDSGEETAPTPPKRVKRGPPSGEKKGSKLKYVVLLFLLLGAAGGGYYRFFMNKEEPRIENFPITPMEHAIQVEKPPVQPIIKVEPIVEPPPTPAPVVVKTPKKRFLIQVATCSYDVCKEDFINSLRRDGEPVYQRSSGEKYDFIELVSKQVFSYSKANEIVKEINRKNKMAGNASIVFQSNGHRVSLGTFPALDKAKEIKFNVEKIFPRKDVLFNLEHVREDYTTTKVYAGPYDSWTIAKKVLRVLRSKKKYRGAFLVRY